MNWQKSYKFPLDTENKEKVTFQNAGTFQAM
jgi:hypothetical protein